MPQIDYRVTINRPLFDVFKTFTDFESYPQWMPHVRLVKLTEGTPIRPGTMLYLEKHFGLSTILVTADFIEFQRNKLIELSGVHGQFRFRRTIEFSSTGRETLVTDRTNIQLHWLYFWYGGILSNWMKRQLAQEWDLVKGHVVG